MGFLDLDKHKTTFSANNSAQNSRRSLLEIIISFFIRSTTTEALRKTRLREIKKSIAISSYKFYRTRTNELLPGLARYFYEAYKTAARASQLIGKSLSSEVFQKLLVESYLPEEAKKKLEQISAESISTRLQIENLETIQNIIRQELHSICNSFTEMMIRDINSGYRSLIGFVNFANFDFYYLLRKFGYRQPEMNFSVKPEFLVIKSDQVLPAILDFMEVFFQLNLDADWNKLFTVIKEYKNTEVIHPGSWNKFLAISIDIKRQGILEQIIRCIREEPTWIVKTELPKIRIAEQYLSRLRGDTEGYLIKSGNELKNKLADSIFFKIFGIEKANFLKFYNAERGLQFTKKGFEGYTFYTPLNCLKGFLNEYFTTHAKDVIDHLVIRGLWADRQQSHLLAENYFAIATLQKEMEEFDNDLGDDTALYKRLTTALGAAAGENWGTKAIQLSLKQINRQAQDFIIQAIPLLSNCSWQLTYCANDLELKTGKLLLNWHEVDSQSPKPLAEWIRVEQERMDKCLQLLKIYFNQDTFDSTLQ